MDKACISKEAWRRRCAKILIGLVVFLLLFYWASGDQLFYTSKTMTSITAEATAAVMGNGTTVEFEVTPETKLVDNITVLLGTYGVENTGTVTAQMLDKDQNLLGESTLVLKDLKDYEYQVFAWEDPIDVEGKTPVTIRLQTQGLSEGQAISAWYGTKIQTVRLSVPDPTANGYRVDGVEKEGKVCYEINGRNPLWIGDWYWAIAGGIVLLVVADFIYLFRCLDQGKRSLLIRWYGLFYNYRFLVKQLVNRDFKKKYKRSVLGVFWSFLNPLLTMLVQYVVFSTIFRSSIENFIVYLLCGIVIFNFFGEALSLGLTSIVDNAALINKVYMPKEIYPISRVLSSVVNLLLSLIPMLVVTLGSGVPLTKSVLLIPVGLFMLFMFSLGLAFLLATSMVFFRDTQFLWNVIFVLWSYLTPTFYPLTILPGVLQEVFKLNPMYQYITFLRTILMYGQAPSPTTYIGCALSAVVMLVIGVTVFRKHQNKFILHL